MVRVKEEVGSPRPKIPMKVKIEIEYKVNVKEEASPRRKQWNRKHRVKQDIKRRPRLKDEIPRRRYGITQKKLPAKRLCTQVGMPIDECRPPSAAELSRLLSICDVSPKKCVRATSSTNVPEPMRYTRVCGERTFTEEDYDERFRVHKRTVPHFVRSTTGADMDCIPHETSQEILTPHLRERLEQRTKN